MYVYIKGTLIEASPVKVILEVQGIGYKILIGAHSLAQLPQIGGLVVMHVSYVIREFSQTLYGFLLAQERDLFEILLNVSGIGPKLALSMISHLPMKELFSAVSRKDLHTISKVPGIGKKTAERLVIELQDKLAGMMPAAPDDFAVHIPLMDPRAQMVNDAMSALVNLGYTQATAQKAIRKIIQDSPELAELSELITQALRLCVK